MQIHLTDEPESIDLFNVDEDALKKIKKYTLRNIESDDIHARAIRLTGDRLNSQLGRFRTKDLPKVMKLTHGANVTVGHNREAAPLGRFFDGRLEREGDDTYLVEAFYFPKDAEGDKIANRLDFGIYKEFSIAFMCEGLICSECGGDMRDYEQCIHFPGDASKKNEGESIFYWYNNVARVIEGSIVLAGAHPGTGIVRDFTTLSDNPEFKPIFEKQLSDLPTIQLGTKLASVLNDAIDARVTDRRPRSAIISQMAEAAGITVGTVNQILAGTMARSRPRFEGDRSLNCPPLPRLRGFARVLRVALQTLRTAAEGDGCTYD